MALRPIIVANWKMNPGSSKAARELFDASRRIADKAPGVSVIIAPPSLYLLPLSARYSGSKIKFAAQHALEGDIGAHTGDISMGQLKDAKIKVVIAGHAERRAAGESDDDTRKQVASALQKGLTPILCVGERERSASGEHFNFVRAQLRAGFGDVADDAAPKVIVAYEPVWAIGATQAMSPRQMHEMSIYIRKCVVELRGEKAANLKILYGGAIDDTSALPMMQGGDVAGLLIGRASTNAEEFALLITSLTKK